MDASIAGGMYGMLSILGRHERRPDREFVVALSSMRGFMTINGRAFLGNTPVFRARVGDRVRWDVMAMGDDFHTFHVHGHRWLHRGVPEDVRTVGPAESFAVSWREQVAGCVVLPLPRRVAHDGRDDRPVRGAALMRAARPPVVALLALALSAPAAAHAAVADVMIPGTFYSPATVRVLAGDRCSG